MTFKGTAKGPLREKSRQRYTCYFNPANTTKNQQRVSNVFFYQNISKITGSTS